MAYWRIRKEWNDGKWDKTQKGAYLSFESALNSFTENDKNNGYKIFSPTGIICYPYHELTQMMLDDGIMLDVEYWDNVFNNNLDIHNSFVKTILCRYSELLRNNKKNNTAIDIININDLNIYKIPINRFKIRIVDKTKNNINYSTYFNAGYFAKYKEAENNKMIAFTLPVANIVADYSFDELPAVSHKYLKERKYTDKKIYFGSNDNGAQFKNKLVSTLLIRNNTATIERVNDVKDEDITYAISGYPIILNGEVVSFDDALLEGWDSGVSRNTYHNFIGVKNDGYVYCFYYQNFKNGRYMVDEIYNLVKSFGFKGLIKLDGGGSAIFKYDNDVKMTTSENRQINSICIIE